MGQMRVGVAGHIDLQKWVAWALGASSDVEIIFSTDDGLRCVEASAQLAPDVVILSLELKSMDGLMVIQRIKKSDQTPKCLALSFWPALRGRIALAGADGCIDLPCTRKAFLRILGGLLPSTTR